MSKHTLTDILNEALMDEYKARDTYQKIIDTFGPVRPFINIVEAEQRHIEMLLPLYEKYAIPLPIEPDPERVTITDSLQNACQMGVEEELTNMAMYDRLIAAADQPDVIEILQRLQAASRDHHLPAFQRCAQQAATPGSGQGFGRGSGQGAGRGRGRGTSQGFGRGGRGSKARSQQIFSLDLKHPTLIVRNFLRQSERYLFNHTGAML
jgi:hypothetical protein